MQEHGEVGEADEARIAALFREAASGAPPPGFDAAQVVGHVATDHPATAFGGGRGRAGRAGGGRGRGGGRPRRAGGRDGDRGVGAGGRRGRRGGGRGDAARAAAPEAAAAPDAGGLVTGSPIAPTVPDGAAAGGPVPGAAAVPPIGIPLGPGPTDHCADRQDPALRALVEQVLPEVVGAPRPSPRWTAAPAATAASPLRRDGGVLVVRYLPPGAADERCRRGGAPTASGGTVVSSRRPGGGRGSVRGPLDAVVAYLAPRL